MERGRWVSDSIGDKYVELLRQYYHVGGMPAAVKKYVETRELRSVRQKWYH